MASSTDDVAPHRHVAREIELKRLFAVAPPDVSPIPSLKLPKIHLGKLALDGTITSKIFQYLSAHELATVARVSRAWKDAVSIMKQDRAFLRSCANRGFYEGPGGATRGKCWQIACGADIKLARVRDDQRNSSHRTSLYKRLLDRQPYDEGTIHRDTNRTQIHNHVFADPVTAERALANLLLAYSVYDPAVGYCQGMNFLAAFLLTKMNEEEAFWTLCTLLTSPRYNLRDMYMPDLRGLMVVKYQFKQLVEVFLPDIHKHFARNQIHSDMHTEWFMTLFAYSGFPRETAARIWDLFVVDGFSVLHRVALAILYRCREALLLLDFEGIIKYLRAIEQDKELLHADRLIATALSFEVTDELLSRLERQYHRVAPSLRD